MHFATATLARYAACPREGHFKAALRVYGYLKAHTNARIDVDPELSVHRGESTKYEWTEFYPGIKEEIPPDMPPSKGKPVSTSTYEDADHAGCQVTRRSVTGVLLFVNSTPIQWYFKRQNTVETSTYGSELISTCIGTELSMALR